MMLSDDQARSILTEAASAGYFGQLPEESNSILYEANEILSEAKEAWTNGAKGEFISTVLSIANVEMNGCVVFDNSVEDLKLKRILQENMSIPQEVNGQPPEFPRDISVVSDKELRKLHAEFAAMLARANWLVAIEETDEISARQVADLKHAQAIRRAADTPDKVTSKAKTVPMLEAEAVADDEVKEWRANQTKHYIQIKLLKALRDNYQMICERISREWSMREKEQTTQAS